MLCISIKPSDDEAARRQIAQAAQWGDLIEWRLDALQMWDIAQIAEVMEAAEKPLLLTLRGGDIERQKELAALQPAYMDVEPHLFAAVHEISPNTQWILSRHVNERMTPEELFAAIPEHPGVIRKGVLPPGPLADTFAMIRYVQEQPVGSTIGICMGQEGQATRFLGKWAGNALTFASLSEGEETAPGQIPAEKLARECRFSRTRATQQVYGLLGEAIDRSFSPLIHNAVMEKLGLNALYIPFPTPLKDLSEAFSFFRAQRIGGLSVTMPHKLVVLPFLDQIDPKAEAIGAVNTLTFREGKIMGSNTDGDGACDALEKYTSLLGKRMVILGGGGAARAIAYEAKARGARVTLAVRNLEKGEAVAEELGVSLCSIDRVVPYDIVVNATPSHSPLLEILPGTIAFETKTSPYKNAFLTQAEERGCTLVHGIEMLVAQAIGQLMTWFPDVSRQKIVDAIPHTIYNEEL